VISTRDVSAGIAHGSDAGVPQQVNHVGIGEMGVGGKRMDGHYPRRHRTANFVRFDGDFDLFRNLVLLGTGLIGGIFHLVPVLLALPLGYLLIHLARGKRDRQDRHHTQQKKQRGPLHVSHL